MGWQTGERAEGEVNVFHRPESGPAGGQQPWPWLARADPLHHRAPVPWHAVQPSSTLGPVEPELPATRGSNSEVVQAGIGQTLPNSAAGTWLTAGWLVAQDGYVSGDSMNCVCVSLEAGWSDPSHPFIATYLPTSLLGRGSASSPD